jgi:hypothetical protein
MPAYSFQKQFVPRIESGDKTHTIRGKRKNRPRPGQTFYGYYAMRTKQCRKLIQSVITRVQDIVIEQGERVCDLEIRASEGLKVYWNQRRWRSAMASVTCLRCRTSGPRSGCRLVAT